MNGREVVVVEAVRTPIGRGHPQKGYFKDVHPANLLAACYSAVVERSGIDPATVGDVISGCVMQYGEQSYNIARTRWLLAGFPHEVPGTTIDRQCGSAQQAVNSGAALIASGEDRGRGRSAHDADRTDPGFPAAARPQRDGRRRHRPLGGQRGVRVGHRGLAAGTRRRPGPGRR